MVVQCVSNKLSVSETSYKFGSKSDTGEFNYALTVGRFYIVYGFATAHGELAYLIPDDNYIGYPAIRPAALFGEPIGTLPSGLGIAWDVEGQRVTAMPAPFVEDEYFWDKLTDGHTLARRKWVAFRLMADAHAWTELISLPSADEVLPTLFIAQESSMLDQVIGEFRTGYH